jgi:hypothetical protein
VLTTEQQIEQAARAGTPAVFSQAVVDGSFLAELLSGRVGEVLHPRGLDLRGLRIVGCDWIGCRFRTSVSFTECNFEGQVHAHGMRVDGDLKIVDSICTGLDLSGTRIRGSCTLDGFEAATDGVSLEAAEIGGRFECKRVTLRNQADDALYADGATIKGDVFLTDFEAVGKVRLLDATIGGGFYAERATFRNETGDALSADGVIITGSVSLTDFNSSGEVRLLRATIGGPFFTKRATFRNETGDALSVDLAVIKGGVFLSDDFRATGRVSLVGAETTWLDCQWATFDKGTNETGKAFDAHNITVNGNITAKRPDKPGRLVAIGEVDFSLATVRGQVRLSGASLDNGSSCALRAVGMTVSGAFFLDKDFRMSGTMNLDGASIGDSLVCEHSELDGGSGPALEARDLKVANRLVLKARVSGSVDLTGARAGELDDDPSAWPGAGLRLTGFVYGQLSEHATGMGVGKRLEWIRCQTSKPGGYVSQPYLQLAEIYKANGLDDDARSVLIAKQQDLRKFGVLTRPAKVWNALLGTLVGHGYRPWRAAIVILVVYVLSVGIVWIAMAHNDLIPVGGTAIGHAHLTASHCTDYYPCVSPIAYPVDAAIPLINLQQADYWQLNSSTTWGAFTRGWLYLATVLGWVFTTMLAVALSGLIRDS